MSKFYAVARGRTVGVYTSWEECKKQVSGYSGAKYKSFSTRGDAITFINENEGRDSITAPCGQEGLGYTKLEKVNAVDILNVSGGDVDNPVGTADGTVRSHIPKGNTVASSNVDHSTGTAHRAVRSRIPKVIEIYTDGSHDKTGTSGYLGFGAFCKYNSVEYRLSAECKNKLLNVFGIGSYRDKISNPTAEFIAFAFVLNKLKDLRNIYTFKFHIDYVGVINWMNGTWKAREPYIIAIKEYCDKIITGRGLHIEYIHVKGHSGVYGNEEADKLASSKENKDEFNELVDVLSLDDNL